MLKPEWMKPIRAQFKADNSSEEIHLRCRFFHDIDSAWGGENRRVYRWNFNPIFVPYLKVSGVRCQE